MGFPFLDQTPNDALVPIYWCLIKVEALNSIVTLSQSQAMYFNMNWLNNSKN